MENIKEKRGRGRPKKYQATKTFTIRLSGEQLETLDYVKAKGEKKHIRLLFVAFLEQQKKLLERQEVKELFRNHIKKSTKRNARLESSVFGGLELQFFGNYWIKSKDNDELSTIDFHKRNIEKIRKKFPEKIAVGMVNNNANESIETAVSMLFTLWQWQGSEENEKAFIEKILKSEWFLYDEDDDTFYSSPSYTEQKLKEIKND